MPVHVRASTSVSAYACARTRALRVPLCPCVRLSPRSCEPAALLAPGAASSTTLSPSWADRLVGHASRIATSEVASGQQASMISACPTKERKTNNEADGQMDTQALFQPAKQMDGRASIVSTCRSHASTDSEANKRMSKHCFNLPVTDNKQT